MQCGGGVADGGGGGLLFRAQKPGGRLPTPPLVKAAALALQDENAGALPPSKRRGAAPLRPRAVNKAVSPAWQTKQAVCHTPTATVHAAPAGDEVRARARAALPRQQQAAGRTRGGRTGRDTRTLRRSKGRPGLGPPALTQACNCAPRVPPPPPPPPLFRRPPPRRR
jgi:hypothetical protein